MNMFEETPAKGNDLKRPEIPNALAQDEFPPPPDS